MTHFLASQICKILSGRFNNGFEFRVLEIASNAYEVCVDSSVGFTFSALDYMFSLAKIYDLSFGVYPVLGFKFARVKACFS